MHTMVRVMRGGEEVKISKRAGSYVTLRDVIDWTSKDAVRFFLLSRKADTEYIFDIDLALAKNNDNPVYYVQYAHAPCPRVFEEWGSAPAALDGVNLAPLTASHETALMQRLAEYPETIGHRRTRTRAAYLLVHHLERWREISTPGTTQKNFWWMTRQPSSPAWPWPTPRALRLLTAWPCLVIPHRRKCSYGKNRFTQAAARAAVLFHRRHDRV